MECWAATAIWLMLKQPAAAAATPVHMSAVACCMSRCPPPPQIYHELAGLQELRFNWRDKVPPYSLTTSLAGAMQHYPDRDLLLAMYHVPQVGGGLGGLV